MVDIDLLQHLAVRIARNPVEYKLINLVVKAYVPPSVKFLLILFLGLCSILNIVIAVPLTKPSHNSKLPL